MKTVYVCEKDNRVWGVEFTTAKLIVMNRKCMSISEFESGDFNICLQVCKA